jgi:hypothetical protein
MASIIPPSDLNLWRKRLFEINWSDGLQMSPSEWETYWPYVSIFWRRRNTHKSTSQPFHTTYYRCSLWNGQPPEATSECVAIKDKGISEQCGMAIKVQSWYNDMSQVSNDKNETHYVVFRQSRGKCSPFHSHDMKTYDERHRSLLPNTRMATENLGITSAAPTTGRIACPYPNCNRWFQSSTQKVRHFSFHFEGQPKQYVCSRCEFAFTTVDELEYHAAVHRRIEALQLACQMPGCNKLFSSDRSRDKHETSHDRGKPEIYPCRKRRCKKKFASVVRRDLHEARAKQHSQKPQPEIIQCRFPRCRKVYSSIKQRGMHEWYHDRGKPRILPCQTENCRKTFGSVERRDIHENEKHSHLSQYGKGKPALMPSGRNSSNVVRMAQNMALPRM